MNSGIGLINNNEDSDTAVELYQEMEQNILNRGLSSTSEEATTNGWAN